MWVNARHICDLIWSILEERRIMVIIRENFLKSS
jgi:hypothetical protein